LVAGAGFEQMTFGLMSRRAAVYLACLSGISLVDHMVVWLHDRGNKFALLSFLLLLATFLRFVSPGLSAPLLIIVVKIRPDMNVWPSQIF